MPEPFSLAIATLVKTAPAWAGTIRNVAFEQVKRGATQIIDEQKHSRQIELALKNAFEVGLAQFSDAADRDLYREVLRFFAESYADLLRQEALKLFTLTGEPEMMVLNEKFNLSQRIAAAARGKQHQEIDVTPYLSSFFDALVGEFFNDNFFRVQVGDVLRTRATLTNQRTLSEVLSTMRQMYGALAENYSVEQFNQDVANYVDFVEKRLRLHKFTGVVLHQDEEKAPELDCIFVPLRILSQGREEVRRKGDGVVDLDSGELVNSRHVLTEHIYEESISSLLTQSPHVVLLGGPGSGKSTLTRYLAWIHARANLSDNTENISNLTELLPGKPIPLRIELRLLNEARRVRPDYSFVSFATEVLLGREGVSINSQMFEELLDRHLMLVLFDGLDEVTTLAERRQLVEEIETFAQRYRGNRIIVTSRPVGYDAAPFADTLLRQGIVQDFGELQIRQFVENWYRHVLKLYPLPADAQEEMETFCIAITNNTRLHNLAVNPLLLTVMTALHRYERLPDKRVQVYEKCAGLLIDIWARLRHGDANWLELKLATQDQLDCLAYLGHTLHQHAQLQTQEMTNTLMYDELVEGNTAVDVSERFMRREVERFLTEQRLFASGAECRAETERFLKLVRMEAGLIVERGTDESGESLFGFVHRTFQEYFAATHIDNRAQDEGPSVITDFINGHLHDPHWREVILLLFGKLRRKLATAQLKQVLAGASVRSKYARILQQDLFFVCDCLAEEISVENDFVEDVLARVVALASKAPFNMQRAQAVLRLAAISRTKQYGELGRKGIKLILEALSTEDPESQLLFAEQLYSVSRSDVHAQRLAQQILTEIAHSSDVPVLKCINAAHMLYIRAAEGSQEQREAAKVLLRLVRRADLPIQERIQAAIGLRSLEVGVSPEERKARKILLSFVRRIDLPVEERAFAAFGLRSLSMPSLRRRKGREEQEAIKLLLEIAQRVDLPAEHRLQTAMTALILAHTNSPQELPKEQEAAKILLNLARQKDLPEQWRIHAVGVWYSLARHLDRRKRQVVAKILLSVTRRADLPIELRIQAATTLFRRETERSPEEQEAVQVVFELAREATLPLEHRILALRSIYDSVRPNSPEANEARMLWTNLCSLMKSEADSVASLLIPLSSSHQYFSDRVLAIREIVRTLSRADALKAIRDAWRTSPSWKFESSEHSLDEVADIAELAANELLPDDARDELYRLLERMAPDFDKITP